MEPDLTLREKVDIVAKSWCPRYWEKLPESTRDILREDAKVRIQELNEKGLDFDYKPFESQ
jgi:hypothetical protein